MLTKEENQLLINEFVEKNVDAITNLGEDKQKAILNAILLIQNKFGNINQSLLKDDFIKQKQDEPLPFKVGDKFYIDIRGKGNIYIIDSIDSNRVVVKVKLNDDKVYDYDYSIEEVKKAFEDNTWIKIEDELPFKVGDKFTDSLGNHIHTILEIDQIKDYFEFEFDGSKYNGFSIKEVKEKFEKGEWKLIEDEPQVLPQNTKINFEVGQILFDVNVEMLFEIVDITNDEVKLVSGDFDSKYIDKEELSRQISNGYLLANFKRKDVFINDNGDIITILGLNTKSPTDISVGWIKDGYNNLFPYDWNLADIYIRDGSWKPLINKPQTPTFKFQIGDTFEVVSNKSTWTIVDIVNDFDEYIIKNDVNLTTTPMKRQLLEEDVEFGRLVQIVPNIKIKRVSQIVKNQQITTSTTTTTTSNTITRKTKTTSTQPQTTIVNKDEEIEALEEAIETQKLLLSFADTKDEKDEIKNLLKDLRSQLKKLKK